MTQSLVLNVIAASAANLVKCCAKLSFDSLTVIFAISYISIISLLAELLDLTMPSIQYQLLAAKSREYTESLEFRP